VHAAASLFRSLNLNPNDEAKSQGMQIEQYPDDEAKSQGMQIEQWRWC
jgi:hypothetical protein